MHTKIPSASFLQTQNDTNPTPFSLTPTQNTRTLPGLHTLAHYPKSISNKLLIPTSSYYYYYNYYCILYSIMEILNSYNKNITTVIEQKIECRISYCFPK